MSALSFDGFQGAFDLLPDQCIGFIVGQALENRQDSQSIGAELFQVAQPGLRSASHARSSWRLSRSHQLR